MSTWNLYGTILSLRFWKLYSTRTCSSGQTHLCPIPVFRLPAPSCVMTHRGHTAKTHTQKLGTHDTILKHMEDTCKSKATQEHMFQFWNSRRTHKSTNSALVRRLPIVAVTKGYNVHEKRHLWSQNFSSWQGLTRYHEQFWQIFHAMFDQDAVRQNMLKQH